jgi:hypothetical protein
MNLKGRRRVHLRQLTLKVALAGFQILQLMADAARVAVTLQDERPGPFNAAGDLLKLLAMCINGF